jgi:hypothetical protein
MWFHLLPDVRSSDRAIDGDVEHHKHAEHCFPHNDAYSQILMLKLQETDSIIIIC